MEANTQTRVKGVSGHISNNKTRGCGGIMNMHTAAGMNGGEGRCILGGGGDLIFVLSYQGKARTQSPTTKNDALESPAFGVIAGVSPSVVQWKGLALGEPPS